jgi:DNA-binding IclR family transcriptional regulator
MPRARRSSALDPGAEAPSATRQTALDRPPEEAAEDTSFARGLRLLLAVADRGEIRADELGGLLEMPVSTVYRYLRTLADFGFVDRHGGQYRLGPRLLIGSGSNVSSELLVRRADPVLRMLVAETGETAVIVRRVGLAAMCLHEVESAWPLRVTLELGEMAPLHAGALARTLLAFAPAELVEEVLAGDLARVTPRTPDATALREGLGHIVTTGLAESEGEVVEGSVAIAAPIFRADGIVGAVGLIGPQTRCGAAWRRRVRRLLPEAARTITEAIAGDRWS